MLVFVRTLPNKKSLPGGIKHGPYPKQCHLHGGMRALAGIIGCNVFGCGISGLRDGAVGSAGRRPKSLSQQFTPGEEPRRVGAALQAHWLHRIYGKGIVLHRSATFVADILIWQRSKTLERELKGLFQGFELQTTLHTTNIKRNFIFL